MNQNPNEIQPLLKPHATSGETGSDLVFRGLFWYVIVLTGLAIVAYLEVYVHTQIDHWGFPYNSLAYAHSLRLTDFTAFDTRFKSFGTPHFWTGQSGFFNYPAPDAYVYLLFFRLFPHSAVAAAEAYDATIAGVAVLAAALIVFAARKHKLVAPLAAILVLMLITSYPLMLMADRCNVEGAAWVMALVGAWAFVQNYGRMAAIFFGCAAALKLAPLILIFLFLRRRDWKGATTFITAFFIINFVAMWFIAPHIAQSLHAILTGIHEFKRTYLLTYSPAGIRVDHSLFSVVKQGLAWADFNGSMGSLFKMIAMWYHVYELGWAIAICFLIWHFARKPLLNCIFAVFIVQVLSPGISFDYTLLYMYIPWALFVMLFLLQDVFTGRVEFPLWKILAILIPMAILFTPQQCYLVFPGSEVGLAGQLKAVTLLFLLWFVVRHPMPCRAFGESAVESAGEPTATPQAQQGLVTKASC